MDESNVNSHRSVDASFLAVNFNKAEMSRNIFAEKSTMLLEEVCWVVSAKDRMELGSMDATTLTCARAMNLPCSLLFSS